MLPSVLNCTRCDGAGEVDHWRKDGTLVPCTCCDGRGTFDRPDLVQLCTAIKGRKPGTVRSKRPDDVRAWFMWRMFRFHSGKDVTLPMTATIAIEGDPWKSTLDAAAEMIAKHFTGRESIGSARWRHAIHGEPSDPAVVNMPVTDGDKPWCERLELQ